MELDIWAALGGFVALGGFMWQSMRSLRSDMNERFKEVNDKFKEVNERFKEVNHRLDRQHDDHKNLVSVVSGLQVEVAELRGEMRAQRTGQALPAPVSSEK